MEYDFLFIGKSAADKARKGRNEEYHEYFITFNSFGGFLEAGRRYQSCGRSRRALAACRRDGRTVCAFDLLRNACFEGSKTSHRYVSRCTSDDREAGATGKKVGITIKPATPAEAVEPYLELVDMVLVMTVEPGFGGQKLIPECLDKVMVIRKMITDRGLATDLEVDGGIHLDNVALALEKGANVIVAGSAVFKDDIAANAKAFLAKMQ